MPSPRPPAVCTLSAVVADRVREIRIARGWPQSYLAKLAGVAPATITVMENHQRNVTLPLLERLAAATSEHPAVFFAAHGACGVCRDQPRAGFTCNVCGTSASFLGNIA